MMESICMGRMLAPLVLALPVPAVDPVVEACPLLAAQPSLIASQAQLACCVDSSVWIVTISNQRWSNSISSTPCRRTTTLHLSTPARTPCWRFHYCTTLRAVQRAHLLVCISRTPTPFRRIWRRSKRYRCHRRRHNITAVWTAT